MAFAETKEELPAELPPEVITAEIEADAALDDFTVARDAVDEFGLLVIRAQTKGASRDELARLQRAWEAAREELAEPEERLQKARRAYSEARQSYEARRNWAEQVAMADANTAAKNEERSTRNRRLRSEEHTSELQSLMRTSYAVF